MALLHFFFFLLASLTPIGALQLTPGSDIIQSHSALDEHTVSAETYLSQTARAPWVARSIEEIFRGTNTDKLWRHGYHRYYEKELAPFREQTHLRLLEIGADSGISLGAWLTYFKDPVDVSGIAYGVDASAAKTKACSYMPDKCDQLNIFSLDQSDEVALNDMKQKAPDGWDIVIDDGSHKPEHQIISFQSLWEKIRPGGVYVIEDVETSYVDTGSVYGYPLHAGIGVTPPKSAVEKFKQLADVVSRKHFGQEQFSVFGGVDKDVAGVYFADGIIFVYKKPAEPEWDQFPVVGRLFFNAENTNKSFQKYRTKLQGESDPSASRNT